MKLDEVFTEVEFIKAVGQAETGEAKTMLTRMDPRTFEALTWVMTSAHQLIQAEQIARTEARIDDLTEEE